MPEKECVKVVIRLRPLNSREKADNRKVIVDIHKDLNRCTINKPDSDMKKTFTFDAVFDMDSKQKDVYEEIGFPLIESVFGGFNGTIFAYGQTGSGKTYTMMGSDGIYSKGEDAGIVPRMDATAVAGACHGV